jgi:hypothetical protein
VLPELNRHPMFVGTLSWLNYNGEVRSVRYNMRIKARGQYRLDGPKNCFSNLQRESVRSAFCNYLTSKNDGVQGGSRLDQ